MSFSFCVNKNEILTLCGLSLLYQGLDLKKEGKLLKDGQRLIGDVANYLDSFKAPGAADFRKIISSLAPETANYLDRRGSNPTITARTKSTSPSLPRQMVMPATSRFTSQSNIEAEILEQQERMRRATLHTLPIHNIGNQPNTSHNGGTHQEPEQTSHNDYHTPTSRHPLQHSARPMAPSGAKPRSNSASERVPNLDYMALNSTPSCESLRPKQSKNLMQHRNSDLHPLAYKQASLAPSEWESLLASLDSGSTSIFDAVYSGSAPCSSVHIPDAANAASQHADNLSSTYPEWDLSPEAWDMTALNMVDFEAPPTGRSVLSISEESLSSGEDLGPSDYGGQNGMDDYRQSLVRGSLSENLYVEGLDAIFGLSN